MENTTELPDDYNGLLTEYKRLKKELDTVNQNLYDCSRQLKVSESLQREYMSEIDFLQRSQDEQSEKLKEKILQLEEMVHHIRLEGSQRVSDMENKLLKKDEDLTMLKQEIELLKNRRFSLNPSEDVNKLIDEVSLLKSENEKLLLLNCELHEAMAELQEDKQSLQENVVQCLEEINGLKECLNSKRTELSESKELIQKLNDDIYTINNELQSLKNQPLDSNSKGNSLFAEVNDRRVYLQETINKMKGDYIFMKQERAKNLKMISHLKIENMNLCERWKGDLQEMKNDNDVIIKSLQNKIDTLEGIVNQQKRQLQESLAKSDDMFECEYFQLVLNSKEKDIESLQQKLMSKASSEVLLTHSMAEANKEIRKWRAEAILRKQQLGVESETAEPIVQKHEETKENCDPNEPPKSERNTKVATTSILKHSTKYHANECVSQNSKNKECLDNNDVVTCQPQIDSKKVAEVKHVRYAENVEPTKVTSKINPHCKKVIISRPKYIPSFSENSSSTTSNANNSTVKEK